MAKFSGFSKEYLGLSKIEIEESKRKFGANELFEKPKLNLFEKLILALSEPMFLLLFGAAFIYFILGEYKDGIIMFFFICIIFGIDFYQEWKTGNVLEELKELSSPQIRVIRDGKLETILSTEIVVKDIIIIEEGEKVPIDGKVLEMFDLGVDESLLTGESDIVWKKLFSDIYAGSIVIQGSAVVEVLSVGKSTQIGKIGLELTDMKSDSETLEKKTRKLVKIIGSISGILCIFIFFLNFYKTENFTESLLLAITLAMTGIPEDFPVILTVFLAMGAWRLAKKNALVRSVPVVEVLGRVTVLCVDKTGTLTKNKMTLKELKPDKKISEKEFIYWSSLACETEPYDPMEKSILLKAVDFGLNKDEIFKYPLLEEYPFNPENKYMGHLWEISNEICLAVKGSPESVIPLCYLSENDKNNFIVEYENLSKKGYRVLAVARKRNLEKIPIKIKEVQLELIGLLGFMDPPRESVIEAIETCKKSGIRVVMITGDS
ncbi:MAG: HAD-IC family P-type ATPase, partial [Cetobacterium sp.]